MKRSIFLLATGMLYCQLACAQTAGNGKHPINVMLTKDSVLYKRILPARYKLGRYAFDDAMKQILTPYFRKSGMNHIHGSGYLTLVGKITENGNIIDLAADKAPNSEFVTGLITKMGLLPALQPALADGKPVKEMFYIALDFERGYYIFRYRFLGPVS